MFIQQIWIYFLLSIGGIEFFVVVVFILFFVFKLDMTL